VSTNWIDDTGTTVGGMLVAVLDGVGVIVAVLDAVGVVVDVLVNVGTAVSVGGGKTVKDALATLTPSVAVMTSTPATTLGTVITAVNDPRASAVVVYVEIGVVLPARENVRVITGAARAKPVPLTVVVEPARPDPGVGVITAVAASGLGAAGALCTICLAACAAGAAAEAVLARGAATSIGTVLSKSAAVNANAAKLLRSEFKVPSSSEIEITG